MEPGGEYVLLRNMTDEHISLIGWTLQDSKQTTELPQLTIAPQEIVALGASELARAAAPTFTGRWFMVDGRIGNGLGNSGDQLALVDSVGIVIDALSWGDNSDLLAPPIARTDPGLPLQRYSLTDTDTAADWEPPLDDLDPTAESASPAGETVTTPQTNGSSVAPVEMGRPEASAADNLAVPDQPVSGRLSLSEVAPGQAWVELYNPQSQPNPLAGWQLDDDNPGTPPLELDAALVLQPHQFLVIRTSELAYRTKRTIRLLRPDGSVGDSLTIGDVAANTTWSRFPTQGGSWQASTPPTPGDFNQPAPLTATAAPVSVTAPVHPPAEAMEQVANVHVPASMAAHALPIDRWPQYRPMLIGLLVCAIGGSWFLLRGAAGRRAARLGLQHEGQAMAGSVDEHAALDERPT